MAAPLSPLLAGLGQYPFARLDGWRAEALERGLSPIDFGAGDPRELTPAFIREALVAGIEERSSYPRAAGLPELREAIAGWIGAPLRRRGRPGDRDRPDARLEGGDLLVRPDRARRAARRRDPRSRLPVYERGALFSGADVVPVPLLGKDGWLPDLDSFEAWDDLAIFWTCYPNNPTGASAPLSFYEELAGARAEHGFLLCSDEAYSELWFGEPPVSALQVPDRENVVVFNTLSKRSSMTGYRSGFVCAPRGRRRRAAHVPPLDRDSAAGVRPACLGRCLVG